MSDRALTGRDRGLLRGILQLTRADHREPPRERMFQLLAQLELLIGCDALSLQEHDCLHQTSTYLQTCHDGERWIETCEEAAPVSQDWVHDMFWKWWWTWLCSLPVRTGKPVVVSTQTYYSHSELSSSEFYVDYLRCADDILVGYPGRDGRTARFVALRETGSAFGSRELAVLELLQPHLEDLVRRTIPPAPAARPPCASTSSSPTRGSVC